MDLASLGLWGLFLGNFLAATVLPFSSDALYIGALAALGRPVTCLVVASIGNWLGSLVTYGMGRLGRPEWIEKWFKVKPETLEKQRWAVNKYGVWLALIVWVPIIGDVFAIALGFYRTNFWKTAVLLLVGKTARFVVWTLLMGLF